MAMMRRSVGDGGTVRDDGNRDDEVLRADITLPEGQLFDPNLDVPPMEVDLGTIVPGLTRAEMAASSAPCVDAILAMTQQQLQNASKRVGQSSSGAKSVLVRRLVQAGVSDAAAVQTLAYEFEITKKRKLTAGPPSSSRAVELDACTVDDFRRLSEEGPRVYEREGGQAGLQRLGAGPIAEPCREREPNWHKNETARLCHVIADPRNAVVLQKHYNKPENRAELDRGRHDPWSHDFPTLFNDPTFRPDVPEISGGASQEELDQFDPSDVRNERSGAILKKRWTSLRSKFSIAYSRWSSSGQGDQEAFPDFVDGDTTLLYCFCVFHGRPAMEYAIRLLPSGAQAEEGIPGFEKKTDRTTLAASRKRSRTSSSTSFADVASQLADALSKPVRIERSSSDGGASTLSKHTEMADAVLKLLELEEKLQKRVDECGSPARRLIFEARLTNVSDRIAKAMGVQHDEDDM
jgi:hypothetical protein